MRGEVFEPRGGNEVVPGGAGTDTLVLRVDRNETSVVGGALVDACAGTATDPHGGSDSFSGIEHFQHSDRDDRFTGGPARPVHASRRGGDTCTAGSGPTVLDYSFAPAAFAVAGRSVTGPGGGTDTLIGPVIVRGSFQSDPMTGHCGVDTFEGNFGDDTLRGEGGADVLSGGSGDDGIDGADGDDLLGGQDGDDVVVGGGGKDALDGGAGKDALDGGAGDDTLRGGAGDDALDGREGEGRLDGGPGGRRPYRQPRPRRARRRRQHRLHRPDQRHRGRSRRHDPRRSRQGPGRGAGLTEDVLALSTPGRNTRIDFDGGAILIVGKTLSVDDLRLDFA